ncbi:TetR family transcriptional regulator (plasmid) [Enterobacteriaceae bacterium Kacie_13]|nr:TetR family transcriptional regulator [Enterobacteriaceae bacterium Kacie_13]
MKENPDSLRAKILDGAISLFIEKGIEKVTTRELTEHVGISRSHIYHYFRDWQTLCIEALSVVMLAELKEFTEEIALLHPQEKLHTLVRNYLPDTQGDIWQLYGSLWQLAAHNEAYAELAQLMVKKWLELLAEIISAGIHTGVFRSTNAGRVTRQLSAIMNGYSDQLIVMPSAEARQEAMDDILDFVGLVLEK